MRKIEFRGKIELEKEDAYYDEYHGAWLYGYYFEDGPFSYIAEKVTRHSENDFDADGVFTVDPKTVGKFTGLLDKNGKKIFEDDIIRFENKNTYRVLGAILNDIGSINRFVLEFYCPDVFNPVCVSYREDGKDLEVIGNIYDNSDILKYEEEQNGTEHNESEAKK